MSGLYLDSHCHVGEPEYDVDREAVLERARAAGVTELVVAAAGSSLETNRRAVDTARRHAGCHAVVGVHPHDASKLDAGLFDAVRALAAEPEVVGIGETGLDFHYDHSPREVQREVFRRFLALARELDLPAVVHSRAAADETVEVLDEAGPVAGVMHCFTYGPEVARRVLDRGLYVSFSGIVTFRSAEDVRAAARLVPLDRMLVETDSPYLAPEPKRGGRNEPARVVDVVRRVAEVLGRPVEEVAEATAANARRLFRLG